MAGPLFRTPFSVPVYGSPDIVERFSLVTREAAGTIYTHCGPEISCGSPRRAPGRSISCRR